MIISQRLVKRICPKCKVVHNIDQTLRTKVKNELIDIMEEDEINELVFYK